MAAYSYVKLVQHGTITAGQSWSIGLGVAISSSVPPTEGELSTWLASLDAASATWWGPSAGPGSINSADSSYDGNKAYYYPAGSTVATAIADRSFSSVMPGGQPTATLPQRTCLVSSLLTGMAGRSFRGRRYIPMTGIALAGHQAGSGSVGDVASHEATFLRAINASEIASAECIAVVVNNRSSPPAVVEVLVNSLPDTQRRRTDKVGAAFTSVQIL